MWNKLHVVFFVISIIVNNIEGTKEEAEFVVIAVQAFLTVLLANTLYNTVTE